MEQIGLLIVTKGCGECCAASSINFINKTGVLFMYADGHASQNWNWYSPERELYSIMFMLFNINFSLVLYIMH